MSDLPQRRPGSHLPLYDAICLVLTVRELTDARLAEVVGMWSR